MNDEGILLASGVLTWPAHERRSDRYGSVRLSANLNDDAAAVDLPLEHCGRYGRLLVQVLENRPSRHIGDLFHMIFPTTPAVGDWIILGEGILFDGSDEFGAAIGLEPVSERSSFWLDPHQLYKVHDQTVDLYFHPIERSEAPQ